jgi:hypothetical protein
MPGSTPGISSSKKKTGFKKIEKYYPRQIPQKKGTPVPAKNIYHQQPLRME